jgi:hypothetical protein
MPDRPSVKGMLEEQKKKESNADQIDVEIQFVPLSKRGHAVTQLVEALRYKPEGRGFVSRWCHWIFSLT